MSPHFPIMRFCSVLMAVLVLLGIGLQPVHSEPVAVWIITVNSFEDIDDNAPNSVCSAGDPTDGPCTLRSAIYEANQNIPYEHIIIRLPAGEYDLTIPPDYEDTVPNDNHSGDLNLSNAQVPTSNTVTIEPLGSGNVVIQAKNDDRILYVDSNFTVTIRGITFTGGNRVLSSVASEGGGAIYNLGNLALEQVSLLANHVTCEPSACETSNMPGGAIVNKNKLVLNNSTVDGNSASRGSAIFNTSDANTGNMTISYSTISNNTAGSSATIMNYAEMRIWNSTFSGNSLVIPNSNATSGIENLGTLRMQSTTLANKGWNSSVLNRKDGETYIPKAYFKDNIFYAESGFVNCWVNPLTTWISEGYNISNDNSCQLDTTLGDGDLSSVDPQLGSFGNWGGSTNTYLLKSNSPALDHRKSSCFINFPSQDIEIIDDQRHWPRDDGQCDTGAYEFSPFFLHLPFITK